MSVAEPGNAPLSRAQEDYLKQIFLLAEIEETVTTQALAEKLDVRPASVSGMLRRLAAEGLVAHEPYRGVRLTERGRTAAMKLLRLHRLLETFLHDVLGYGWDEVHDEAERLEHVISDRFERRMADALGNPTHDPHGDPIPSPQLDFPPAAPRLLVTELEPGARGEVVRVLTQDRGTLALLERLALRPGSPLEVADRRDDGVLLRTDGEPFLLPRTVAAGLHVRRIEP